MHDKTQKLLDTAVEMLAATHPMTVRQTFYQLVSRQVIKNDRVEASRYNAGGKALLFYHGEYSRFDELSKGISLHNPFKLQTLGKESH